MRYFVLIAAFLLSSCGYYNTFYNAKKYYKQDEYKTVLEKCEKLLGKEKYADLHDDAWFYTGASYAAMDNTEKAIDAYQILINSYPESKYAAEAQKELFFLHLDKGEIDAAYNYIEWLNAVDAEREDIIKFAKVLFVMSKEDELAKLSERLGTKDDTGREVAAYRRLLGRGDYLSMISGMEDNALREKLAEAVFYMTLDFGLLDYTTDDVRKKGLELRVFTEADMNPAGLMKSFHLIDDYRAEYSSLIYKRLLDYYISAEKFDLAKFIALKLKDLQGDKTKSDLRMQLVNKIEKIDYKFLPDDITVYFTDGNKYYVYDSGSNLYSIQNGKWELVNAETPPRDVSEYENIIWDSLNRRWVMFNHDEQLWDTLSSRDYTWSSVRVEGDELPIMNKKSLFIHNRTLYYFAGTGTFYKITFSGNDKAVVSKVDIKGIVPNVTGYTLINLLKYNYFAIISGKKGESISYSAYYLDVSQENPKWEEKYIKSPLFLSDYIIIPYNTTRYVIFNYWDSSDLGTPRGALVGTFDSGQTELSLYEVKNEFESIDKIFDYEHDVQSGKSQLIHYFDNNRAYNQLQIYRLESSVRSSYVRGNLRKLGKREETDIIFSKIGEYDFESKIKALSDIEVLSDSTPDKYRVMGDIILSGLDDPGLAASYYRRHLEEKPEDVSVLYAMAHINFKYLGDLEAARAYIESYFSFETDTEGLLYEQALRLRAALKR